MPYNKSERPDSPMRRRGGRRRKKVCAFCDNKKIRKFPALITAKIFGFDAKPQFKAEASATQAPTVEF